MSTTHITDELPRLLTGDATRDEVLAAGAHLRTCIDCQQELVSATVAHASLASAQRFAPEIVAPRADDLESVNFLRPPCPTCRPCSPRSGRRRMRMRLRSPPSRG